MTASTDERIQRYYSINPKQFSVLTSLIMSQELPVWGEPPVLNLEIVLQANEESGKRLLLKFKGVRSLVVRQPDFSVFNVSLIEISSIIDLCVAKRTHSKSRWVWRTKAMSKSASCPAAWIESVTA